MTAPDRRIVFALANRHAAESGLERLRSHGFDMGRVTVFTRPEHAPESMEGAEVQTLDQPRQPDHAFVGAVTGGGLGVLGGLAIGTATITLPVVGPVLAAGSLVPVLLTALGGGALGAGLGSLLWGLFDEAPPDAVAEGRLREVIEQGGYVVLLDGTADELREAQALVGGNVVGFTQPNKPPNPTGSN